MLPLKGVRGGARRGLSWGGEASHGCIYRHKHKASTPSRFANPKVWNATLTFGGFQRETVKDVRCALRVRFCFCRVFSFGLIVGDKLRAAGRGANDNDSPAARVIVIVIVIVVVIVIVIGI